MQPGGRSAHNSIQLIYNSEQAGEIKDLMWHPVQCIEVRCNSMERWVFLLFTAKCCFVEFSTPSSMQYAIVCAVKSSSSSCVRKYKSVQLWGVCAGTVVWCARTATVEGIPDVGGVLGIPLLPNISPKHTLTPPDSLILLIFIVLLILTRSLCSFRPIDP